MNNYSVIFPDKDRKETIVDRYAEQPKTQGNIRENKGEQMVLEGVNL